MFYSAATPAGAVHHAILAAHCKPLLAESCHGIGMLGATGEANSFGLAERQPMLNDAFEAGIEPSRVLPGAAQTGVADTLVLTRHAVIAGWGVVLLPPFYCKGVSEEGMFRFYGQTAMPALASRAGGTQSCARCWMARNSSSLMAICRREEFPDGLSPIRPICGTETLVDSFDAAPMICRGGVGLHRVGVR
ncbi:dihydrodipicolinate synthase family protein [Chelativorans sp.]|uniref:dihydrodipicolinate synthase family protein n=1 Tax=Chelativorans sp. TaxID=2203393 RepID=UPI00281136C6|nr:dihydrodipicolinate synthase family protein [Chelativorans sp.]